MGDGIPAVRLREPSEKAVSPMAQQSQPTALLPRREAITAPTVAKHRNTRIRLASFRSGPACRLAVCSTMAQAVRITVATQTDQASQAAVRAFTAACLDDTPLVWSPPTARPG